MPALASSSPAPVGPYFGQPAGFQNVVIPCVAQTEDGIIVLNPPNGFQWLSKGLYTQQVFGAIADATPTGDIYLDIATFGPIPVYDGINIANGAIEEGDYCQFVYDPDLGDDGGFQLLNWTRPATGQLFTLTTLGTSGPATLVGSVLNVPNYSGAYGGETLIVTDANPITVLATDGTIVLNKAAPSNTTINLPEVALRNGLSLTIVDFNGNGGDITINASAGQTIMSLASATLISGGAGVGTAGFLKITPNVDLLGWYQS